MGLNNVTCPTVHDANVTMPAGCERMSIEPAVTNAAKPKASVNNITVSIKTKASVTQTATAPASEKTTTVTSSETPVTNTTVAV